MTAFLVQLTHAESGAPRQFLQDADTAPQAIEIALGKTTDCQFLPEYDDCARELTEGDLSKPETLDTWLSLPVKRLVYWPDNSELPYTKEQFIQLCHGNARHAFLLYGICEGQCPETILDEVGGLKNLLH